VDVPETRYAKSGEVHIAYQAFGDGSLDLVFVPGVISNVEIAWQNPLVTAYWERLASFARVIWFDKRGTGVSDPVEGVPTLEARMDDVRAVMEAAGSERAALMGVSEGGPMTILFAATHPERTAALVLFGTAAKTVRAHDYPWGATLEEAFLAIEQTERHWGETEFCDAALRRLAPSVADDPELKRWWRTYVRVGASPATAAALQRMNMELDVRHVLHAIRVPTLVLHRKDDADDIGQARYLAEQIPTARFVELEGADHFPWAGDLEAAAGEIERFLAAAAAPDEPDRVLATILFTDIVGSTTKAAELGDTRWRELLREHYAEVRRQLARYRGQEIDAAGDGIFASFDGPARAVRCARAIVDGVSGLGLEIRAGLHTGEFELDEGRIRGIAVHIGARVAAEAGPGEVLVSSTVKDLVAGSGLEFEDRGATPLKGVPGEWRLFAVNDS
jgi:class 3 adenylate cyclase/esterase/lipase